MTRILVLSDTHIPRSANDLPQQIYDELPNVEMIIHAGDFVEKDIYDRLKTLKDIKAVYGNMDSMALRRILNNKEVIEVGKIRIGLIHGYGAPRTLADTVAGEFSGVNAIVFGHSHAPLNYVKDGVLFFNPGSPTDKIYAAGNSYGILEIENGNIEGKIIKI